MLHTARAVAPAADVTVISAELTDDAGRSNLDEIERLLTVMGLLDRLHVIPRGAIPTTSSEWSQHGPHLDSLPATNRLISEIAQTRGAHVVLTGNGADELLGTTRYLVAQLARRRDPIALRAYLGDTLRAVPRAAPWELLGLCSPALPRRARARLFLAVAWADLQAAETPTVLGSGFRDPVARWTQQFLCALEDVHIFHHDWATMDAWDSVFPAPELPQPGLVPWASPFREPSFVTAAQGVPLVARYDATAATPYWRAKAGVVALFPEEFKAHLPIVKESFGAELERHHHGMPRTAATCQRVGLVDPEALRACDDAMTLSRVAAVEEWLSEAVRRGFSISA